MRTRGVPGSLASEGSGCVSGRCEIPTPPTRLSSDVAQKDASRAVRFPVLAVTKSESDLRPARGPKSLIFRSLCSPLSCTAKPTADANGMPLRSSVSGPRGESSKPAPVQPFYHVRLSVTPGRTFARRKENDQKGQKLASAWNQSVRRGRYGSLDRLASDLLPVILELTRRL